jgi:hypothetical protein
MLNAAGSCDVLVCLLNLLLGKGLWADGGTKYFLFAKMAGGGEKPLRPSVFMSESKSDDCVVLWTVSRAKETTWRSKIWNLATIPKPN